MEKRVLLISVLVFIAFVVVLLSVGNISNAQTVYGYCPNKKAVASADHQGKSYDFCCEGCKARFLSKPEIFSI